MKKNIKRRNKKMVYLLLVVLCGLGLLLLFCFSFFEKKSQFTIESRTDKLKEKKNDKYKNIGWIRVEGTNIDMPIVYSSSDEELPVTEEGYSWTLNEEEKLYDYIKIYGHNIFNLSATPKKESKLFKRFEELMAFVYYDFAKENQYIQLTLNNEEHLYQIFSVGIIEYKDISKISPGNYSDKDLKNNIKFFEKESIYNYNISVDSEDKLISLITCTKMYGTEEDVQMIITGKKVNNKKRNLEKVVKNNNYKKVEKSLKGADTNENV